MTTASFNLVEKPWIPVTLAAAFPGARERGPAPRVSLREAFEYGDRILDLRCYPHERIALMRLLICIAQRALNGPADEDEWRACRAELSRKAVAYLEEYKECFNLFGDGPRFLQAHGCGQPGVQRVFRLELVDENTPALFDAHVHPGARLDPARVAVALITYQSFAAGGKTGGSEFSKSRGKKEPQGAEHALCRDSSAIHAFVLGDHLLQSIWWNLVTMDSIAAPMKWTKDSLPIWEIKKTRLADLRKSESELRCDYLARLAPLSRAIWLHEGLQEVELASGLRYGVFSDSQDRKTKKIKPGTYIREVSASVHMVGKKDAKPRLVSAAAEGGLPKGLWHELHAIAVLGKSEKRGGPVALEHLRTESNADVRLWCGALVGDQAKVVDIIESVFRLPVQFLEDADASEVEDPKRKSAPNQIYQEGVKLAETWSGRLRAAVKAYRNTLGDQDRGGSVQTQAATRYWTTLEQKAESVLLYAVAVRNEGYAADEDRWIETRSPWGREVRRAALDAYDFTCPHATPKQLRAYAEGLKQLFGTDEKKNRGEPNAKDAEDADTSKEGTT